MLMKGKRWSIREIDGEFIVEEVKVEEKEKKNNMFIKKIKEMAEKKKIRDEKSKRRANWLKGIYNEYGLKSKNVENAVKYAENVLGFEVDEVIYDEQNETVIVRFGVL